MSRIYIQAHVADLPKGTHFHMVNGNWSGTVIDHNGVPSIEFDSLEQSIVPIGGRRERVDQLEILNPEDIDMKSFPHFKDYDEHNQDDGYDIEDEHDGNRCDCGSEEFAPEGGCCKFCFDSVDDEDDIPF